MTSKRYGPEIKNSLVVEVGEEKPSAGARVVVLEQRRSERKQRREEEKERRRTDAGGTEGKTGRNSLDEFCVHCDRDVGEKVEGSGRLGYLGADQCAGCWVNSTRQARQEEWEQSLEYRLGQTAREMSRAKREAETTGGQEDAYSRLRGMLRRNQG